MRHIFLAAAICAALCGLAVRAAEAPAEFEARGADALKLSQTQPDAIVAASIFYGKASAGYEAAGNTDKATEMNSYLYWCKKKMTLQQMDVFLKKGETDAGVAVERLKALDQVVLKAEDAGTYFDRADSFAQAHPGEHLLIAVRFFEIADRFKGSNAGIQAQDRSLKELLLTQAQADAPPNGGVPAAVSEPAVPVPPAPALETKPAVKAAVPSPAQQKDVEKVIKDLFKNEFARTAPADQLTLARKLADQADQTKDDPSGRYVLYIQAINLAAQSASLDLLLDLNDTLSASFDGDFKDVKRLSLNALIGRTKDAATSKEAAAFKTLLEKPDAAASAIAGKYFCFSRGDWAAGLPLLAASNHPVLSALAKQDLAAPRDPARQSELADSWWELSDKSMDKEEKLRSQQRAVFWYAKVLPGLSGLIKVKIEKRIAAFEAAGGGKLTAPGKRPKN